MKQIYNLILLSFFITFYSFSQESINARLLDSISKKPIPYATISLNNNSGVISNDRGKFLIHLSKKQAKRDSLLIRCMGYETKHIAARNFTDTIVFLNPKSIELEEVLVSNKTYTPEEIIEKVKENLNSNYTSNFIKSKLFYRESNYTNVLKNHVEVKKTTIPEFNQNFIDSVLTAMPKNADEHTEILANVFGKPGVVESQKLDIIKASHLYDKSTEITFEGYEEKFNTIIKKHVKRDSYFKIKSGVFGTKEAIDSTFFEDTNSKEAKQTQEIVEQQKKQEQERKNDFLKYRKTSISKLQRNSFVFNNSDLNFIEKSNKYIFTLEDYSFLNDDFVYILSFKPKRNADYSGTLYINTDDFAIVRVDYKNVKPLKTFNLLGLSYNYNLKKGTLIYNKNNLDKYALQYVDLEEVSKFGIKRPLKIIEKNKHTKGRRRQNELSTDLHFIMAARKKQEIVIFENTTITETNFTNFTEKPKVKPIYLPKYDPEFWKGYNIIEPNQAIKDFKSIELK